MTHCRRTESSTCHKEQAGHPRCEKPDAAMQLAFVQRLVKTAVSERGLSRSWRAVACDPAEGGYWAKRLSGEGRGRG